MRARFVFFAELFVVIVSVLITRCVNYRDVFANGQIYFADADCYARMTRARICLEHPGTIIRHHDFENFPTGTSPHTTAPFDYLIVAIAALLMPVSRNALDLSGAILSPLIAVALGVFLCWWTRRIGMRFRFALLALYAVSPILVHGTALGRPDHQSLLLALVTVGLCADWMICLENRALQHGLRRWNILSGASWAMALWVSLYEPLILLGISSAAGLVESFATRRAHRKPIAWEPGKWLTFAAIIVLAVVVERRVPASFDHYSYALFSRWSSTIGELSRVPLMSGVWFQWCGWLVLLSPILFWRKGRGDEVPWFVIVSLVCTFVFTMMQARWGYFFAVMFALVAPAILSRIGQPVIAYSILLIALFPLAQAWDKDLSEQSAAIRAEKLNEQMELRAAAFEIDGPVLAPWWCSPALTYWSRQPAVGGSSHESLSGIADSATFYAVTEEKEASAICGRRKVKWVLSYDAERLAENSSRLLGRSISPDALCYVLDRHPSAAPAFLKLVRETARFKLYRVKG